MVNTKNFKITGKSFIMRIGSNSGTLSGCGYDANAKLKLLAAVTDSIMSENPLTDNRDGKYRLYSSVNFSIIHDERKIVSVIPPILLQPSIDRHVGQERMPARMLAPMAKAASVFTNIDLTNYLADKYIVFTPPGLTIDLINLKRINDTSYSFGWRATGRPANQAEPMFQNVCLRRSRYIWHRIFGKMSLLNGKIVVDAKILGSEFPSHRAYVNGRVTEFVPQGPFSNLWIGSAADSSRVNETSLMREILQEAEV